MGSVALFEHFPDPRTLLQAIVERRLTEEQRARLRAFLRLIEVPDCTCAPVPACKCQRQCLRGLDLDYRPRPYCGHCQGPCRCPCKCCDPRTEDCGCLPEIFQMPCRHILAAPPHGINNDLWVLLLEAAWPRQYRDPPRDPECRRVVTPRGLLARAIWRRKHGYHLWREGEEIPYYTLLAWRNARDQENRPVNPAQESTLALEETA